MVVIWVFFTLLGMVYKKHMGKIGGHLALVYRALLCVRRCGSDCPYRLLFTCYWPKPRAAQRFWTRWKISECGLPPGTLVWRQLKCNRR